MICRLPKSSSSPSAERVTVEKKKLTRAIDHRTILHEKTRQSLNHQTRRATWPPPLPHTGAGIIVALAILRISASRRPPVSIRKRRTVALDLKHQNPTQKKEEEKQNPQSCESSPPTSSGSLLSRAFPFLGERRPEMSMGLSTLGRVSRMAPVSPYLHRDR